VRQSALSRRNPLVSREHSLPWIPYRWRYAATFKQPVIKPKFDGEVRYEIRFVTGNNIVLNKNGSISVLQMTDVSWITITS
jgi:hypothetical protein